PGDIVLGRCQFSAFSFQSGRGQSCRRLSAPFASPRCSTPSRARLTKLPGRRKPNDVPHETRRGVRLMTNVPVRRALISVSDKSGLADFAQTLRQLGVEIFST